MNKNKQTNKKAYRRRQWGEKSEWNIPVLQLKCILTRTIFAFSSCFVGVFSLAIFIPIFDHELWHRKYFNVVFRIYLVAALYIPLSTHAVHYLLQICDGMGVTILVSFCNHTKEEEKMIEGKNKIRIKWQIFRRSLTKRLRRIKAKPTSIQIIQHSFF